MDCLCPFFNGTSFLYLQTINISRSLPSRKSKQFSAIQAEANPECGQAVKQKWRLLDPLSFGKNNQRYRVFFRMAVEKKKKAPNISHRIQVENSGKWKNSECKHFLKFKTVKKNSWPSFWANCAGAFFHVFVGALGCSDPLWLLIGEQFLWTKFCSDPKKNISCAKPRWNPWDSRDPRERNPDDDFSRSSPALTMFQNFYTFHSSKYKSEFLLSESLWTMTHHYYYDYY